LIFEIVNQARGHATCLDQYCFFAIFDHRGLSEINAVGVRQLPAARALSIAALLKPDSSKEKAPIKGSLC
jgi:hypothetical protein